MGARKPNNFKSIGKLLSQSGQVPLTSFQDPGAPDGPSGIFSGLGAGPTAAAALRPATATQLPDQKPHRPRQNNKDPPVPTTSCPSSHAKAG